MKQFFLLHRTSVLWGLPLLFLLASCSCPEDTPIGDLYLDTDITSQIPYQGDEVIQFVNGRGDTLDLQSFQGLEEDSVQLNVAQFCAKDLFDVQHLFYFSNQISITFQASSDPEKVMALRWSLLPIDTTDDATIPAHVVGYMTVDSWLMDYGMKLIIDDRGAPLPETARYYQNGHYVSDTILAGRPFQDIYCTTGGARGQRASVFYQPQRGIVAWQETNGDVWLITDHHARSFHLGQRESQPLFWETMRDLVALK